MKNRLEPATRPLDVADWYVADSRGAGALINAVRSARVHAFAIALPMRLRIAGLLNSGSSY
jgi:hypothetical protein